MNLNEQNSHLHRDDEELDQLLLELHYGLLDDEEASALRSRIESNPQVAARWAQTLVIAGKFAEAAKLDSSQQPAVGLSAKRATASDVSAHSRRSPESDDETQRRNGGFVKLWWISLAAAASLLFVVSGYRHWTMLPTLSADPIAVAVQPVYGSNAVNRNEFLVVVSPRDAEDAHEAASSLTFDSSMPIVPATISFQVLSKGTILFFGETETNADHPARIQIPDEIVIPLDATLEIDAAALGGDEKKVRLSVPLEPTRCLTFISTDRPVYRPGERLFFRSVTLNRRTLASHIEVPIRYELIDPSGAVVEDAVLEGVTERGVGNGVFVIPESSAGGTYEVVAKSLDGFFPEQRAEIEVRRYRAVRLKTDLEFEKRSFVAGDLVEATLSVRRANDEIPVAATAKIQATIDGEVIYQSAGSIDLDGTLNIGFKLPKFIRDGDGTLSVVINDGSVTETAARPIPIHTGKVSVEFFPEGGYLVVGLDNRVYFSARDTHGKPIELAGEILSQAGRVVATVETLRDGMGRFNFKPEPGLRYSLRVTKPLDITETPWLPTVEDTLPVMDTGLGVFEAAEPITLTIHTLKRRKCIVRAVCRGELVGVRTAEIGIGSNPLSVPIQDRAAGVIRVTVLDAETESGVAKPLVERLVYRRGTKGLKISADAEEGTRNRQPGQPVRMTVSVTDEHDQPVPGAVLGVRVVDDAAISLRQDDLPSIKTHFLLTSEVQSPEDLEHADFYLSDDPKAAESLDLLLGTQGWRRFISGTPDQFDESFRESLARLLELDGARAGLVGKRCSNANDLRSRLATYRVRTRAIWKQFINEVRWLLMVLGFVWLIGFLLRPRRSFATAAGMLFMGASLAIQLGCSVEHSPAVGEPVADLAESEEHFTMGSMEMEQPPASGSMNEADLLKNESAPADPDKTKPPQLSESPSFARRVIDVFIGKPGEHTGAGKDQSMENRITVDQLTRFASARGVDARSLADQLMEELRFPIRQYAHTHRQDDPAVRSDFTETLYWNPLMVTDSTGTASIRFDLSDSLTMFKVMVDGHTTDGRLGSGEGAVITRIPLEVDAKIPLEVTSGDRIDLPVGLVNSTDQTAAFEVEVNTSPLLSTDNSTALISTNPGDRIQKVFSIDVNPATQTADATVEISAQSRGGESRDTGLSDTVLRQIRIVPDGFPFTVSKAGTLQTSSTLQVDLPEDIVAGSLRGELKLLPGTQSQISSGLESILREPHGCFEQASSTNYPNVMIFQLMQLDGTVDESERRRIASLLFRGYRKLTSYECRDLGYEWFGNDPGHEALSAFGLMQFSEMAKVIDVDEEMLNRTRQWLLDRRDNSGGFQRNPRHLHVWSVRQEIVNAYVLWALSQADLAAGQPTRTEAELGREIDRMENIAKTSEDAYLIALSAITLANVGRREPADDLRKRLTEMQATDGGLEGTTTITQSGGLSRKVETTALAILAWHSDDNYAEYLRRATDWLLANRRRGGFGSTQATVLALKALVVVHRKIAKRGDGALDLVVDGKTVDTIRWEEGHAEAVKYAIPQTVLEAIERNPTIKIELRSQAETKLPFGFELAGQTATPRSDADCPLAMKMEFAGEAVVDSGDAIEVALTVKNKTDKGRPMTVAVVGLPGGLEPVIEKLDQLRETGTIDYYELRGREIVLYWRTFAPQESKDLSISCVAEVPGHYTGPAGRTYLYYTAESKTWHKPLQIDIR